MYLSHVSLLCPESRNQRMSISLLNQWLMCLTYYVYNYICVILGFGNTQFRTVKM